MAPSPSLFYGREPIEGPRERASQPFAEHTPLGHAPLAREQPPWIPCPGPRSSGGTRLSV